MRHSLTVLAIAIPLAFGGCKKKAAEAAAAAAAEEAAKVAAAEAKAAADKAAAEAAKPNVEFTYGPARFVGEHTEGTVGKFHLPVSAVNNSAEGLQITAISIGAKSESGARVCVATTAEPHKALAGGTASFELIGDCAFGKLPAGDKIPLLGTATYMVGAAEKTISINATVAISQ